MPNYSMILAEIVKTKRSGVKFMISKVIVYEMIDDRVVYLQDCSKSHKRNYDTKLAYLCDSIIEELQLLKSEIMAIESGTEAQQ